MYKKVFAIFALIISLALSSCGPGQAFGPTITPTPTLTPVPTQTLTPTPAITTLKGTLTAWSDGGAVGSRQLVLCQITGGGSTATDCVLQDTVVASDAQGAFQFVGLPAGKYYILYDTGMADFQAGLEQWKGQTLQLSDVNWVIDQYCKSTDGNVTVSFLSGMQISRDSMITLVQALYTCNSPFVLALDPNGTSLNAPLVIEVGEGQTIDVTFKAGSFSG